MDIVTLLEAQARKYADKPAIIFKNESISFRQLKERCFNLASSLANAGIGRGDRVALYLPNCPEYVYSYLAIWCIGATAVPLDFMLTEDELASCLSHCQARMFIARPKPHISLAGLKEKCPALEKIISLEGLLADKTKAFAANDIANKDYACIFYTSGSTGRPKGVLCNYLQLAAPPKAMAYFVNFGEKDTALCAALPFSHIGGLVSIQGVVFLGATLVLMERFIPVDFLKHIEQYKVTGLWLVPSMFYAVLQSKEFESFDLSSLQWIVCFGAPSSADQLRRFHGHCPQADLINGWGMTETQGPAVVLPRGSKKVESVGCPAPWIEVKILDEEGRELAANQVGEIAVRSWVVSDGYYKDAQATAEALRNGWFHTGDLGRLDAEGFLYIAGRKKEMIKVAGEIVFEPEVEAVIHKHSDIAEVAVIGVADKLRGEVPKAFIVLKQGKAPDEEGLRYFCRQHLAHFKIPHYFDFVSALPKTGSGKIDKESLRV
ncbi:MAG: long-chain fatty acid--CoA ligase [Candidatus Omnitrophica bacterium]|nr:long-chain fatty acid--CoA ligase [Candidatus Omnitrophota bacterium]